MASTIAIINGPNLNLTGKREPQIYGSMTFEEALSKWQKNYPNYHLVYLQSNIEGNIINAIQEFGLSDQTKGIILNAGAYAHTSLAIADAVAAIVKPVIGVHLSNIFSREAERHTDMLMGKCTGHILGLGMDSYELAINYISKL